MNTLIIIVGRILKENTVPKMKKYEGRAKCVQSVRNSCVSMTSGKSVSKLIKNSTTLHHEFLQLQFKS